MEHKVDGLFDKFVSKKSIEESKKEIINDCMVEFRKRDLKNNQLFYTVIKKQEDLEGKVDQIIESFQKVNTEIVKKENTDENNENTLSEDVVKHLEEHIHIENVKCFKNVQAAFTQTLTEKLTETRTTKKDGIASVIKYAKAILFLLIILIALMIAFFLYYIGVIPSF